MATTRPQKLSPVFTVYGLPDVRWLVDSYTRHEVGGCKDATVRAVGTREDLPKLQQLVNLLGVGVTVVNEQNDPRWWGFVNGVVISYAGVTFGVDLDGMANRVAVAYTDYAGRRATTAWSENAASRGGFTRKESLITLSDANEVAALYRRDGELNLRAWPQGVPSFDRDGGGNEVTVTLNCLGWWKRLEWLYWGYAGGVYENAVGSGEITFGGANNVDRISQVIQPAEANDPFEYVALPLRRYGVPADSLTLEVRTGGTPGAGTLVTQGVWSAAGISNVSMGEVQVTLDTPWTPDGTQHHFELFRGGLQHGTNYFAVGVDTSQNFTHVLVRQSGVWVGPDPVRGSMQFRLTGDVVNTTQILRIVNGFLATSPGVLGGIVIEAASSEETIPYRNGDATMLNEIENLLVKSTMLGATLLAEITPQRMVRIYQETTSPNYYITPGAQLTTMAGAPVDLSLCPAGVRARLRDVFPAIESSVAYANATTVAIAEGEYSVAYDAAGAPVSESYRFIPRGARDPFGDKVVAHP